MPAPASSRVRSAAAPAYLTRAFAFVLTDGRETETFVLGEGDFLRAPVCGDGFFGFTGMTADLPPARCNPGQSIPCADVGRYEATSEELCKS